MATTSAPASDASRATTGAAPVPVPPPMPAVTKTMSEPVRTCVILSASSSAALRPTSGFDPAPMPRDVVRPSCSFVEARFTRSTWRSVFAATNSIPLMPAWIMRLTALPPPPPTPTTLIFAGGGTSSFREIGSDGWGSSSKRIMFFPPSISQSGGREKQVLEGAFEFLEKARTGAARALPRRGGAAAAVEQETRRTGPFRRGDDVRQPAEAARHAPAHGHAEDLLGDLQEAVQLGAAARQDESGAQLARGNLPDRLLPEQREKLLGARLEDLGDLAPLDGMDAAPAGERHVERLAFAHERGHRRAVLALEPLGVGHGGLQDDREVVREVVPTHGQD